MLRFFAKGLNYIAGSALNRSKVFITSSLDFLQRKREIDQNYFDYIRLSTLELICHEINSKKLSGNLAELGVYQGKFARYINKYLPDKKLYLFDTFEGFDQRDKSKEIQNDFSSGTQNFSNTSIDLVLSKMPNPKNCMPVKGFFPESAKGIEDQFVLVSIDADLYDPIYNGLSYFYPRLVKGGYILVHDFNNDGYKGARAAVEKFCQENEIGFVPISDSGGSAIICK